MCYLCLFPCLNIDFWHRCMHVIFRACLLMWIYSCRCRNDTPLNSFPSVITVSASSSAAFRYQDLAVAQSGCRTAQLCFHIPPRPIAWRWVWTYWSTQPTDKSILFLNVIFNRKKTMHLLLKWKKGKYWGLERKHAQRPWSELNVIENYIRRKKMQEGWGAPSISLNPADSLLQGLVLFVLTNRGLGFNPVLLYMYLLYNTQGNTNISCL